MSVNSCPIPFPLCETQVLALEEFNFFFLAMKNLKLKLLSIPGGVFTSYFLHLISAVMHMQQP